MVLLVGLALSLLPAVLLRFSDAKALGTASEGLLPSVATTAPGASRIIRTRGTPEFDLLTSCHSCGLVRVCVCVCVVGVIVCVQIW